MSLNTLDAIAGLAVIQVDRAGVIVAWNDGAEAIFGHSAEKALGQMVDLIVPENYRAVHWAGFHRAIGANWRGGETWGGLQALHANGDLVDVEVILTGLPDATGMLAGVLALFRRP